MALTRLRMDELVNAWVGDHDTPFQIALLAVFDASPFRRPDGGVDVSRIRTELAARARNVAPLRRRVVWTRPGEGRPVWIEEASFDAAAHVGSAPLPPGRDLATWATNRAVRPLDRNRPLWRAEVVDGLPDGRFALIIVMHHIVADGLAGMAIAGSLLDPLPDGPPAGVLSSERSSDPSPAAVVPAPPSRGELVNDRLREAGAALRRVRLPKAGRVPRLVQGLRQPREALADFATPEPATSLPRRIGPERRMVIVREPLEDLQRTGHALGVTVNDLLLAAVTGGLRELLSARGELADGLVLRTTVPAATGRPGQVLGMLVVGLPVGEPDPVRRLALIHRETAAGKARLRAGSGDVGDMLKLPIPVVRQVVRRGRRYGSSRLSLSVTDVAGPRTPLWLAGARLLQAVPIAPLAPLVPLCAAALSYAGELAISMNADAAVTDLDVLADGMARAFAVLKDATRDGARLPALPPLLLGRGSGIVDRAAVIGRPSETVFSYCTDPSREPQWNRHLAAVDKLTDGPIGVGTRYRMRFRSGVGDSLMEYVGFEPPRSWTSTSTSARLDVRFEGEVLPIPGGSRLRFRARLRPHGLFRPLAPVLRGVLGRRWEHDLEVIRSVLETADPARPDPATGQQPPDRARGEGQPGRQYR